MNTGIVFILASFLSLTSIPPSNCSCEWEGSFLDVSQEASLVALVRIVKHGSYQRIYNNKTAISMEVEVIEVLKGRESRRTLTIWGGNGDLCRPYISNFKKGSTWVIAFSPGSNSRGHSKESENDYTISICGEFWLPVERGRITGVIEGQYEYVRDANGNFVRNEKTISWGAFRDAFQRKN